MSTDKPHGQVPSPRSVQPALPPWKRALRVLAAGLLLLTLVAAAALATTFGGLVAAEDGTELPGGARLLRDGFVNLYVLPAGPNAVALVDCGMDLEGAAIKAELKRRGLGVDAVKAIFITHGHGDHTAACRLFPSARVYTFQADQGLVEGLEGAKGPVPRFRGALADRATRVSHVLEDGESVQVDDLVVQAFHVAGHTGGSAAYLAQGVLYLGDSAAVEADGTLRSAAWMFSDDQAHSIASVRRLAERLAPRRGEIHALATGHSGPWSDGNPFFNLRGAGR